MEEIKAFRDENGGIAIEIRDIPYFLPFCPRCDTPSLVNLACTNKVFCLRCGHEFVVDFVDVDF